MNNFCSQAVSEFLPMQQDKFVCDTLKYKRNGTFLDVGCHDYKHISNTYYLEKELEWTGLGLEINAFFKEGWDVNRKSPFILADATTIDYQKLLTDHNMPEVIDYLSVDLEPPTVTLAALYKIFQSNFSFNVITFETDYYREKNTREPSRELLKNKGFVLVQGSLQDDYYVHSRLL